MIGIDIATHNESSVCAGHIQMSESALHDVKFRCIMQDLRCLQKSDPDDLPPYKNRLIRALLPIFKF